MPDPQFPQVAVDKLSVEGRGGRYRPAGAAALRRDAERSLGEDTTPPDLGTRLWPPPVVPFAVMASASVGVTGTGVLAMPAAIAIDFGALLCYLLALGWGVPRLEARSGAFRAWFNGMGPALLPLWAFVAAAMVLATAPGLPWTVLTPLWLLLILTVCPWFDLDQDGWTPPAWGSTALSVIAITVPVPFFVVALGVGTPLPLVAVGVGLGVLVPSWRLIGLAGAGNPWARASLVAALMAIAALLMPHLQVPGPLLPAAMLIGWYGLAGVAASKDGHQMRSFAAFVIVAAVILAIAAPA